MGLGVGTQGLAVSHVMLVHGNPDELLTGHIGSDIVKDVDNDELYMCEARLGSEWIHLVSGT